MLQQIVKYTRIPPYAECFGVKQFSKQFTDMKEIIASIVVIIAILAGGFYGFKKYDEAKKIDLLEKKLSDIAKYDSRIDSYEIDKDIIRGKLSMQNGFGAWAKKDFEALIGHDIWGGSEIVALFLDEGKPTEYIYEKREEALKARKLIDEYEKIPNTIEELKKVGYAENSEQVVALKEERKRIEKQIPELLKKTSIRQE